MELYISDHPLDCLTCAANGDCELQDMAGAVGLRDVRYGYEGENHVFAEAMAATMRLDAEGRVQPLLHLRPSKCIVCSRCVRACEEVQGTFALTISGPRLRQPRLARHEREFPRLRMRLLRRLRAGLPDRDADGKIRDRDRPARAFAWSPPAPIAASAAPSRRRCAARKSCAWCPTRTARPIAAIPASRAASPGATPPTRNASSSR